MSLSGRALAPALLHALCNLAQPSCMCQVYMCNLANTINLAETEARHAMRPGSFGAPGAAKRSRRAIEQRYRLLHSWTQPPLLHTVSITQQTSMCRLVLDEWCARKAREQRLLLSSQRQHRLASPCKSPPRFGQKSRRGPSAPSAKGTSSAGRCPHKPTCAFRCDRTRLRFACARVLISVCACIQDKGALCVQASLISLQTPP